MATEKRLIDANEAKRRIIAFATGWHSEVLTVDSVIMMLNQSDTVDAVEVPCKMGDVVWGIKKYNHGQAAKQGVVNQMFFGDDMRLCICVKNVCRGEWGNNVFATEEEAIAKMDGDGNV